METTINFDFDLHLLIAEACIRFRALILG